MSGRDKRLHALEDFLAEHAGVITIALETYARTMLEESSRLHASYTAIKDDPDKRAAQDKTLITTHGIRMAGEILADASKRATAARTALVRLAEPDDVPDVSELFDALRGNPWQQTDPTEKRNQS